MEVCDVFSTLAPPLFTKSIYTPRFSLHPQEQTVSVCSTQSRSYGCLEQSGCVHELIKTFQYLDFMTQVTL